MTQNRSKPHGKNLRRGRFSQAGQVYAITIVTCARKPVFADFTAARAVIQVMRGHERLGYGGTLCFVVMPDHLHWLMELGADRNLGQTVQALKSLTSRRIGRPIFQKGFYDHAVRRDEDIKELARYIVGNPLRKGLATDINDYSHWDAVWL